MGFFKDLQRASYLLSRTSGDINAAQRGKLTKRVVRRRATRSVVGPALNRLWR